MLDDPLSASRRGVLLFSLALLVWSMRITMGSRRDVGSHKGVTVISKRVVGVFQQVGGEIHVQYTARCTSFRPQVAGRCREAKRTLNLAGRQ